VNERTILNALTSAQRQYSHLMHVHPDRIMQRVDQILECHGVEPIRSEDRWTNYWGDTIALYVNTGETYDLTLIYDTRSCEFLVESWGDWVEKMETKNECG